MNEYHFVRSVPIRLILFGLGVVALTVGAKMICAQNPTLGFLGLVPVVIVRDTVVR